MENPEEMTESDRRDSPLAINVAPTAAAVAMAEVSLIWQPISGVKDTWTNIHDDIKLQYKPVVVAELFGELGEPFHTLALTAKTIRALSSGAHLTTSPPDLMDTTEATENCSPASSLTKSNEEWEEAFMMKMKLDVNFKNQFLEKYRNTMEGLPKPDDARAAAAEEASGTGE
jgi:hypothetical protein